MNLLLFSFLLDFNLLCKVQDKLAECQQKNNNKYPTFWEGSKKFWAGIVNLENYKLVELNSDFE